jgi:hypothetical protein
MAARSAEPPSSGGSDNPQSGSDGGHAQPREHVGPVTIERHFKDDGRALLLYAREQRNQDGQA